MHQQVQHPITIQFTYLHWPAAPVTEYCRLLSTHVTELINTQSSKTTKKIEIGRNDHIVGVQIGFLGTHVLWLHVVGKDLPPTFRFKL